ncbi:sodium:solute symporter family protein [Alloiococcus sp. CFN-8]|uniref:sodium:solute symporter family protein n=1 Tax=Alloiococcus sp. CFN-8 TaxID=3416081 RepID=UPI003CF09368
MVGLTPGFLIGLTVTLFIFLIVGVNTGRKVKNAADFYAGGSGASFILVAGGIIGTLVGGNSTVGTAQLAFANGLSAWWYTLGASLGCLILGLVFTKPLRQSQCITIQEIISTEFGETAGIISSVLTIIGIIINTVAQILASNALISAVLGIRGIVCTVITIIIMTCYVIFGGAKGASLLGVIKLVLIYFSVVIGGLLALKLGGGADNFYSALEPSQFFNLFSRGIMKDSSSGLSVMLGVLSSQTYVQAVLSGRTCEEARKGAFFSAAIIPPIGILSIFIGMYMRINFPAMDPGAAFPAFIINNLPAVVSGIIIAALFITIVGSGAGMAINFSSIAVNDIYIRFIGKNIKDKKIINVTRGCMLLSLIVPGLLTGGNLKSKILTWGFLSMGLRAVVLFIPLCAALFYKGKVDKKYAIASGILGVISMIISEVIKFPLDSLIVGMVTSLIVILSGIHIAKEKTNVKNI